MHNKRLFSLHASSSALTPVLATPNLNCLLSPPRTSHCYPAHLHCLSCSPPITAAAMMRPGVRYAGLLYHATNMPSVVAQHASHSRTAVAVMQAGFAVPLAAVMVQVRACLCMCVRLCSCMLVCACVRACMCDNMRGRRKGGAEVSPWKDVQLHVHDSGTWEQKLAVITQACCLNPLRSVLSSSPSNALQQPCSK